MKKLAAKQAQQAPESSPKLSTGKNLWLTDYAALKGWGSKVPQSDLFKYLSAIDGTLAAEMPDCSVVDVGNESFLVSSDDFFTPIVGDPYL